MKKTFELTHPKIKPARKVESVKHEVKKYLKRERNKTLPEDALITGISIVKLVRQSKRLTLFMSRRLANKLIPLLQKESRHFILEVLVKPAMYVHSKKNSH